MIESQIVNTYHDNRIQDEHLTHEHYFRFRTVPKRCQRDAMLALSSSSSCVSVASYPMSWSVVVVVISRLPTLDRVSIFYTSLHSVSTSPNDAVMMTNVTGDSGCYDRSRVLVAAILAITNYTAQNTPPPLSPLLLRVQS